MHWGGPLPAAARYDADVHRLSGGKSAGYEVGAAAADGTGSVAVVGRQQAEAYARGAGAAAPLAVQREPLSAHRVNDLYYAFFAARGLSRFWTRRPLRVAAAGTPAARAGGGGEATAAQGGDGGEADGDTVPAGWPARFGLAAEHLVIFERALARGWPADCADLPLEGGRPPLDPVREGSLAAALIAQLEADAAERLRGAEAVQAAGGSGGSGGGGGGDGSGSAAAPRSKQPQQQPQPRASGEAEGEVELVALLPTWLVSHWREGIKGGWGVDPPAAIAVHATNAGAPLAPRRHSRAPPMSGAVSTPRAGARERAADWLRRPLRLWQRAEAAAPHRLWLTLAPSPSASAAPVPPLLLLLHRPRPRPPFRLPACLHACLPAVHPAAQSTNCSSSTRTASSTGAPTAPRRARSSPPPSRTARRCPS